MEQTHQPCPSCGASVPEHFGYLSWCECGWNLAPHRPDDSPSFVDRISITYGDKVAQGLFESMQGRVPRPRLTPSLVLAFALAGLVHLSSLLLVALGVWLIVAPWGNILTIVGGCVAFGIAWVVRPRFIKPPEQIIPAAEYPELYALANEVAGLLGHPPIKGLALTSDFNAFYMRVGVKGHAYISLGLPLWRLLSPQERVGLLGHELGHGVNGDVQRGAFMGSAIGALAVWYALIRPHSIFDNEGGGPGIFMVPFNVLMLGLAQIPYFGAWTLLMLTMRASQRAEYLADYLESTIAGTDAALSGLEKLHLHSTFARAMQRAAVRDDSPFFATLDTLVEELPQREIERVRRVAMMKESRVDATHPPTVLRYRFIETQRVSEPRLTLDDERMNRIEEELRGAYAKCEKRVVDRYNSMLYA